MPGDERVPIFSALYPALKWALEHQSKPDANVNYQPVKFMEYCSTGHTTESIYDDKDDKGTFQIKESKYHGLTCGCNGSNLESYASCNHAQMLEDPLLLEFVTRVAFAGQVPDPASLDYIKTLKHADILTDITECRHIKASIFD